MQFEYSSDHRIRPHEALGLVLKVWSFHRIVPGSSGSRGWVRYQVSAHDGDVVQLLHCWLDIPQILYGRCFELVNRCNGVLKPLIRRIMDDVERRIAQEAELGIRPLSLASRIRGAQVDGLRGWICIASSLGFHSKSVTRSLRPEVVPQNHADVGVLADSCIRVYATRSKVESCKNRVWTSSRGCFPFAAIHSSILGV